MKKQLFVAAFACTSMLAMAQEAYQAFNPNYMDKTVRPQDDLYNYVNGNWMKITEIPSDRARWGSFDELRENTDKVTLQLVKDLIKRKHAKGTSEQKIADLYDAYMNVDARNKTGLAPIQKYFKQIDAIKDLKGLQDYLIEVASIGENPFYGAYVYTDLKNSKQNAVYLGDIDLTLGKTYYQKEDAKNTETLGNLTKFVDQLMPYTGSKTRDLKGPKIVAFEKMMSKYIKTVEEDRDPNKSYNPVKLSEVKNLTKNIDIERYVKALGINPETVIIGELDYYKNLDKILNQENLPLIKDYLRFKLINSFASYSTTDLDKINFEFYGKTLSGQKEQRPMEKRGLAFVNGTTGELLGQIYVKDNFPPEAKANAEELISYLFKSFDKHIKELDWMSAETKTKALEKLNKFTVKIGYPDKWKDYSGLQVKSLAEGGTLIDDVIAISKWRSQENLKDFGKPVDKTRWGMAPQTVNAYFNPTNNEIVFPAAILQPPFYDYRADAAVNFGGIGAVIGHEISHGFDDSGAKFDGDGNLVNWWTAEDEQKFAAATKALATQYDGYEPVKGTHVNGTFTSGENIGDLGGASVAFDGLQMYLKDKGTYGNIDGYTPQQRFFLSWATIWRTKATEEALVNQVKTDPHSPGFYRSFGPIINIDAFHDAFKTKPGDKLYKAPKDRIRIW
ncbi:M13 family metallopeptidase [Empedobacter brevis]|uniref:Endothelin-converting protein n=2 Tax=Empedobacter brevis TaxID=247 RepID=A0A511NJC3_9FLAO|nr:M13 family metallopeptidase [Empedobacter brevis]MDM1073990.1 M13 family metallopeptidase [Empedobacter brevis]QHC84694.1 endothelin-converting protein [Empedobacter brevis]GEM52889.1 endothelin-converting protein [Empedobacter brevis NBRC 14943 = ATCC 43319]